MSAFRAFGASPSVTLHFYIQRRLNLGFSPSVENRETDKPTYRERQREKTNRQRQTERT